MWVVLHSGSRGIGNQLAQMHIAKARRLAKDLELRLEDPDLAYFVEGTPEFEAYIADMLWAQDYARANRDQMMDNAMREVFAFLGHGRETQRINCHHNFTQREVHDGRELWITRKGAIKADIGDLGVIPGSMGTRSYIVRGQGQRGELDVVLARRRPPAQPHQGQEALHHRRPRRADGGQGVARRAGPTRSSTRSRRPTRTSTRSWPTRPTSSRSCTRCTRSSTTRAPDVARSTVPPAAATAPGGDHLRAGEVLKEGRSARTREAAGSIPAAGPAARCEDRGFLHLS